MGRGGRRDPHLKCRTEMDCGKRDVRRYKMLVLLKEGFENVLQEYNISSIENADIQ